MAKRSKDNVIVLTALSVVAIVYIICAILFAAIPTQSMMIANSMFHGIDMSPLSKQTTFAGTITGLIVTLIITYLIAILSIAIYRKLSK